MHRRPYEALVVWKEAHRLCLLIYNCTSTFPTDEKFGLISQMRRSAFSVPMNIVEGNSRRSPKEKSRFFEISLASLDELHYQCRLANDLHYMNVPKELDDHIQHVSYLLTKLRSGFR